MTRRFRCSGAPVYFSPAPVSYNFILVGQYFEKYYPEDGVVKLALFELKSHAIKQELFRDYISQNLLLP